MGPERVVLPAPAVGQALGFRHRGKQFGVEEFIPEPAVERLCKAVLPWGSWLDVGGRGAAVFAPTPQSMGDELRTVVAANERWCWIEAGELLQHRHHILGLAAPPHPDGQAEAAVRVDHVQELEPAAVSGGDVTPFIGPGAMRVGGHAAAA